MPKLDIDTSYIEALAELLARSGLQLPDGEVPDDPDDPEVEALVARSY